MLLNIITKQLNNIESSEICQEGKNYVLEFNNVLWKQISHFLNIYIFLVKIIIML